MLGMNSFVFSRAKSVHVKQLWLASSQKWQMSVNKTKRSSELFRKFVSKTFYAQSLLQIRGACNATSIPLMTAVLLLTAL